MHNLITKEGKVIVLMIGYLLEDLQVYFNY